MVWRCGGTFIHGFIDARKNRYQRFLPADKNIILATLRKVCTVEFVSMRHRALRDCVNFMNFAFWIKYHFNVFNFIEFYFIM